MVAQVPIYCLIKSLQFNEMRSFFYVLIKIYFVVPLYHACHAHYVEILLFEF